MVPFGIADVLFWAPRWPIQISRRQRRRWCTRRRKVFRMVSTCRCSELEPRACLVRTSYPIVVAPLFIMGDMLVWLPQYLLHTELSGWRTCIMLWLFQVKFPFRWMLERCARNMHRLPVSSQETRIMYSVRSASIWRAVFLIEWWIEHVCIDENAGDARQFDLNRWDFTAKVAPNWWDFTAKCGTMNQLSVVTQSDGEAWWIV